MNNNKKIIISLTLLSGILIAAATTAFGQLPPQQPTTTYFDDGSGSITFENGTELHFTHNITGPDYLYENETIYHANYRSEVFLD